MLRWVPCLGSPGPVTWLPTAWGPCAGIWSTLRTPGSLLMNCWATRTCPQSVGSPPILRGGFRRGHDLDRELLELRLVHPGGRAQHQVRHRLRLRERDHVANVV